MPQMKSTPDQQLLTLNQKLEKAIQKRDKVKISNLYREAQDIDLESASDEVFAVYNNLVDKGNDVLYGITPGEGNNQQPQPAA